MKRFEYETGFGGIGNTQRADIVLNANAVNEQSKAFFKEICEKNSIPYIIISGCIFSKLAYSGGVNSFSVTAGFVYNKDADSIIEVEEQDVTESGNELWYFVLDYVVKNDNAEGVRTYKGGANVNCWKEEKYVLRGYETGFTIPIQDAKFEYYLQPELQKYVGLTGSFANYDDLINSPDFMLGTGSISLKKERGVVSVKLSAKTALTGSGQLNSYVFILPEGFRPAVDTVVPYAYWFIDALSGNSSYVAVIRSTGHVTLVLAEEDTQTYCNFSFML